MAGPIVDQQEAALRERVIDAADELYYARGVRSVGMDEVRAAAGVSLKRLYGLFASKDELILAVLDHRTRLWDAGLGAALAGVPGDREKLLAVYDFLERWFGEDTFRGCVFINMFAELGAVMPDVVQAVRAHKEGFRRLLSDLTVAAGGGAELALQLAVLAEGAQTTAAICGTPDAARHARAAATVLIDAVLARPTPDSREP